VDAILKVGSIVLPDPVSLKVDDEIIWSSNAGRTGNGDFTGDVIAEKKTLGVGWEWLLETEVAIIVNNLKAGFFPITFRDVGINLTITNYRGTLSKEAHGWLGDGNYLYSSVSCSIIQK